MKVSTCATTTGVRPTPVSSVVSSSSDSSCGFMGSLSCASPGSDSQQRVILTILPVSLVNVKYFVLKSNLPHELRRSKDRRRGSATRITAEDADGFGVPCPRGRSFGRDHSRQVGFRQLPAAPRHGSASNSQPHHFGA